MQDDASIDEVEEFNTEPRKKNTGFSGNSLWIETKLDKPPYKLGFYMITISMNTTLSPLVNHRNNRDLINPRFSVLMIIVTLIAD